MNTLLQTVLNDAATRSGSQLPLAAAQAADEFIPWQTIEG